MILTGAHRYCKCLFISVSVCDQTPPADLTHALLLHLYSSAARAACSASTAADSAAPVSAELSQGAVALFVWSLRHQLCAGDQGTPSPVQLALQAVRANACRPHGAVCSVEHVHLSALCCLAAVLLVLFLRSTSTTAGGDEKSASILVLLRCWLLRAQELVMACETAHTQEEEACMLRDLHSCAALFCQTYSQPNGCIQGSQQPWCGLITAGTCSQSEGISDMRGLHIFWKIIGLANAVHEAAVRS